MRCFTHKINHCIESKQDMKTENMRKWTVALLVSLLLAPGLSGATVPVTSDGGEDGMVSLNKGDKKKSPKTMSRKEWEKRKKKAEKKNNKQGGSAAVPLTARPMVADGRGAMSLKPGGGKGMTYDQFVKQKGMRTAKSNFITLHEMGGKVYFEMPKKYLGREMLIAATAKESSDPELITSGYKPSEPLHVTFDTLGGAVYMRSVNGRVVADPSEPRMAAAAERNFLAPLKKKFAIHCQNRDSSSLVFEVTSLFDGKTQELNPVSKEAGPYSVQARAQQDLGFISGIKSFDDNLSVESVLTYDVTLSYSMMKAPVGNMTARVVHSVLLLPEEKMKPRLSDSRLGVFLSDKQFLSTGEDGLRRFSYAHRWRVEPADKAAWERGETVEVKKPIVWYVDTLFPAEWMEPIKKAVLLWNKAFERIGLKNAMQVREFPKDDPEFDPDNLKYSCIRYVPASVPNAMGPSWVDPTTGEIVSATVLVYNDFVKLINNWRFTQTAQVDPRVRAKKMPRDVMDESITYVVSHEIGHTLGLMHNMAASSAYPVDSLRSSTFTAVHGTTPSIMDYARFNYVAQPGDEGVRLTPPELGDYDYFVIKWLYSPVAGDLTAQEEAEVVEAWVDEKAGDPIYRYGRQQTMSRYDPSSIEEDLGDDPVKAGDYGIKNLKYILSHLEEWITDDPDYSHRSNLYGNLVNQYVRYISNVVYNVGGIYLTSVKEGTEGEPFVPVSRRRQQASMKWVLEQLRTCDWVDDTPLLEKISLNMGMASNLRQSVLNMLMGVSANVVLSSYLSDDPYTLAAYFDDLYNGIWRRTINGQRLTVGDRELQRMLVAGMVESVKSVSGGGARRLSLADAYRPTVDEIVLYGLDETGLVSRHADEFRRMESESVPCGGAVSFGQGYGMQRPLDVSAIDERAGFFVDMLDKVERLVKGRIGSANATDRAHYRSILLMIESMNK